MTITGNIQSIDYVSVLLKLLTGFLRAEGFFVRYPVLSYDLGFAD
jgi:hypothetical protein